MCDRDIDVVDVVDHALNNLDQIRYCRQKIKESRNQGNAEWENYWNDSLDFWIMSLDEWCKMAKEAKE
jgi:hypothetical protein